MSYSNHPFLIYSTGTGDSNCSQAVRAFGYQVTATAAGLAEAS
jgi:hypothetical protein